MNNISKLKFYLPQAICQLSSFCLNEYCLETMQSRRKIDNLEIVRSGERHIGPWRKNENEFTLAFRNPPNRHLYVTLTNVTFADTICRWMGSVSVCYTLHIPNRLSALQRFCDSDELNLIRESEENEYHKPCQREESREDDDQCDVLCSPIHADQCTTNNDV